MGRSLAPLSRGRIAPSPTKAMSPRSRSWPRILSWFSTQSTNSRRLRSSSPLRSIHARVAISRRSWVRSEAASPPNARRPAAGSPTSMRASTQFSPNTTAVRSSTSAPPASIETSPPLPVPARRGPTSRIDLRNARASQAAAATWRVRLPRARAGRAATSSGTRIRSLEGSAKGSAWTRSMKSVNSEKVHSPSMSR